MTTSAKAGAWKRVSRRRRCPICNHDSWCIYTGDDDRPEAAICQRIESGRRIGEAGWLHRLRDDDVAWPAWQSTLRRAVRLMQPDGDAKQDFAALARRYQQAASVEAVETFASSLGVTSDSLRRLGIGWTAEHRAWTFPMQDCRGTVRGIRLRLPDGRKLSIRGGREGLFIPQPLDGGGRLLVAEGASDVAAILDLRFEAVGRPSCSGGLRLLIEGFLKWQPSEIIIVADADEPGRKGAENLWLFRRWCMHLLGLLHPRRA